MTFLLDGVVQAVRLVATGDREVLHATWVSLSCTLMSVGLAAAVAVPWGAWLGLYRPRAHRAQVLLLRTGMSMPTVLVGLLMFSLLSRQGPLGGLDLLYTRAAIITGEVLLAVPLLASLAHGLVTGLDRRVLETALTLGASRPVALRRVLGEVRGGLAAIVLAAFGRCFTELGIAITVGGNLRLSTRTLASTIQLELARGEMARALAPGLVLLAAAAGAAVAVQWLSREARR